MTGRDFIIYILENHLEESEIFEDGNIKGFINDMEAAEKFGVGTATILLWIDRGIIPGIRIGSRWYIPKSSKKPQF